MAARKKAKKKARAAKKPAARKVQRTASRPAKKPARKPAAAKSSAPNPWKAYADTLEREAATTVKVMRAFPADQPAFQPHPRSGSAMQLFHTFGVEQAVALMCVKGALDLTTAFSGAPPASLPDAIAAFERTVADVVAAARSASASAWNRPQPFFTGPKQMGQLPAGVIAQIMLSDQIHHRGQLSVYVRMAGGKVPSIYGPSGDEPW